MNQTASSKGAWTRGVCLALWLASIASAVVGCSREEPNDPPVATPTFTMPRGQAAIGSPIKLTYRFQVPPDAKFDGDYWVFVHMLNPDGEQMWTDDHLPPTPTSQWAPGETIEYSRTVFVPNYPYVGEAEVRLGIYSQQTGRRLALSAPESARREYVVGKFRVLPASENILLVDKDGWHPAEVAPDNPASEWKWTARRALTSFKNPKKDSVFYIEYDARPDLFTPPQQVTLRVGDQVFGTFAASSKDKVLRTFPIKAAQLGQGEMSELVIEVDQTFKPGGSDTRELGIRVFHTFVEPQ